jgi:hypothetical protein
MGGRVVQWWLLVHVVCAALMCNALPPPPRLRDVRRSVQSKHSEAARDATVQRHHKKRGHGPAAQSKRLCLSDDEVCFPTSTAETTGSFFWLHVPNCGATMEITALLWACPAAYQSLPLEERRSALSVPSTTFVEMFKQKFLASPELVARWCVAVDKGSSSTPHQPYHGSGPLIVMLRDPRRRLVSAYRNQLHSVGLSVESSRQMFSAVDAALEAGREGDAPEKDDIVGRRELEALQVFASWPGIQGCAVKMLNGLECAYEGEEDDHASTDDGDDDGGGGGDNDDDDDNAHQLSPWWKALVRNATTTLLDRSKTMFIGVTDIYNASMCLFHVMHGGPLRPLLELRNTHQTSLLATATETRSLSHLRLLPGVAGKDPVRSPYDFKGFRVADPPDQQLFDSALEVFHQRLLDHVDEVVPCCVLHDCIEYVDELVLAQQWNRRR